MFAFYGTHFYSRLNARMLCQYQRQRDQVNRSCASVVFSDRISAPKQVGKISSREVSHPKAAYAVLLMNAYQEVVLALDEDQKLNDYKTRVIDMKY